MGRKGLKKKTNMTAVYVGVLVLVIGGVAAYYTAHSFLTPAETGDGTLSFRVSWVNGTAWDGEVSLYTCDEDDDVTNSSNWDDVDDLDADDWSVWTTEGDADTYYIVGVDTGEYVYYELVNTLNQTVRIMPVAAAIDVAGWNTTAGFGFRLSILDADYGEAGLPFYTIPGVDEVNATLVYLNVNVTFSSDVAEWSEVNERYVCAALDAGNVSVSKNLPTSITFESERVASVVVRSDLVDSFTLQMSGLGVDVERLDVTYNDGDYGEWVY